MLNSLIYEVHIIAGMITFFIGPLQFIPVIREKDPGLHRLLGKTYVLCVMFSAPTGFIISFYSPLIWAVVGTALQSVLWFATTLLAFHFIRQRNFNRHRNWMLRSYCLVLTAPIVRVGVVLIEQLFPQGYQTNFEFYYPLLVWLGFVPLFLAEGFIRGSNK